MTSVAAGGRMVRPSSWALGVLLPVVASCDLPPTGPETVSTGGVSAGGFHVCRVTDDGGAYCWGSNTAGQVGDGSLGTRDSPSLVTGGLELTLVSAGLAHTCAVDRAQRVSCWGSNQAGRLGDSAGAFRTFPAEVATGLDFATVSAGGSHTCALTADGVAYCWGDNGTGQLGTRTLPTGCGGGTCSRAPVAIGGNLRFEQIATGIAHTCALTGDGAAYCWGANGAGQLGNGNFATAAVPVLVPGGLAFRRISAGGSHTCGVDRTGVVYCWGLNVFGQLGTATPGDETDCCARRPMRVPVVETVTTVSAGGDHTCALTVRGRAYCWGRNNNGQLGNGASFDRDEPQLVVGNLRYSQISAGGATTCAVTPSGATYCWGDNFRNQLGNGGRGIRSTTPILVPVPGAD